MSDEYDRGGLHERVISHIYDNKDPYQKIWFGLIAIGYLNLFVAIGVSQFAYGSVSAISTAPLWLQIYGFGLLAITVIVPLGVAFAVIAVKLFYEAIREMAEGIREVRSDD